MNHTLFSRGVLLIAPLLFAACQSTDLSIGADSSRISPRDGSVATAESTDAGIQRCSSPIGTVRLGESFGPGGLNSDLKLPPPSVLLRTIVEQSNCFVIIERPVAALDNFSDGRARAVSEYDRGRLPRSTARSNSVNANSRDESADYELISEFAYKNEGDRSGGVRSALGGLIDGRLASALSSVSGGLQTREAQVQMTLVDGRTRRLVAASDSSSSKTGIGRLGGSLGGYGDSPHGAVISTAAIDAFNKLVMSVRSKKAKASLG